MIKRVKTNDSNLEQIQDNVDDAVTKIQVSPLLGGNVVTGQALTTGQDNLVAHGLQRNPLYYVVLSKNAQSDIWTTTSTSLNNASSSTLYVNLRCSANVTATIWFN